MGQIVIVSTDTAAHWAQVIDNARKSASSMFANVEILVMSEYTRLVYEKTENHATLLQQVRCTVSISPRDDERCSVVYDVLIRLDNTRPTVTATFDYDASDGDIQSLSTRNVSITLAEGASVENVLASTFTLLQAAVAALP